MLHTSVCWYLFSALRVDGGDQRETSSPNICQCAAQLQSSRAAETQRASRENNYFSSFPHLCRLHTPLLIVCGCVSMYVYVCMCTFVCVCGFVEERAIDTSCHGN